MSQIRDFYGDGIRAQKDLLALIRNDEPATDQEGVERSLLLTLQHPTDLELELAFNFWALDQGGSVPKHSRGRASVIRANPRAKPTCPFRDMWLRWWDSIAAYRSGLRGRVLEAIGGAVDIDRARAALEVDFDAGALRDILVVPRLWWDGHEVKTDLFYLCPTMESRFTLACVKLIGSRRTAESLRVCALEACGRIFISQPPPSGGPRPSYCTAEHRELAARLTGAERTARWRKNQP